MSQTWVFEATCFHPMAFFWAVLMEELYFGLAYAQSKMDSWDKENNAFSLSSLQVRAEASWDSAVHNCPQLSKGTPGDERVFLIVRVTVQLSHPADMQLVLRKRICVNVHGRQVRLSVEDVSLTAGLA